MKKAEFYSLEKMRKYLEQKISYLMSDIFLMYNSDYTYFQEYRKLCKNWRTIASNLTINDMSSVTTSPVLYFSDTSYIRKGNMLTSVYQNFLRICSSLFASYIKTEVDCLTFPSKDSQMPFTRERNMCQAWENEVQYY